MLQLKFIEATTIYISMKLLPALYLTANKLSTTYYPQAWDMNPSGQWLPKITTDHNQYQHSLGKVPNLNNTPTNSLSSPHACTTQGSMHLHCPIVHRLLNFPSRAPVQEFSEHRGSRSSNFNHYHLTCIIHMHLS
jgi:hypothetical protein